MHSRLCSHAPDARRNRHVRHTRLSEAFPDAGDRQGEGRDMTMSAKLALCLLGVMLAPAPAAAREHVILDFRLGMPGSTGLRLFGANAEAVAKTDAEGLRINLPPGRQDVNWVGVELPCRIHGDFEIAVGYELLAVGDPTPEAGGGVQVRLFLDTPAPVIAAVTRLRKPPASKLARLYEHVDPKGETFGAARIDLG